MLGSDEIDFPRLFGEKIWYLQFWRHRRTFQLRHWRNWKLFKKALGRLREASWGVYRWWPCHPVNRVFGGGGSVVRGLQTFPLILGLTMNIRITGTKWTLKRTSLKRKDNRLTRPKMARSISSLYNTWRRLHQNQGWDNKHIFCVYILLISWQYLLQHMALTSSCMCDIEATITQAWYCCPCALKTLLSVS